MGNGNASPLLSEKMHELKPNNSKKLNTPKLLLMKLKVGRIKERSGCDKMQPSTFNKMNKENEEKAIESTDVMSREISELHTERNAHIQPAQSQPKIILTQINSVCLEPSSDVESEAPTPMGQPTCLKERVAIAASPFSYDKENELLSAPFAVSNNPKDSDEEDSKMEQKVTECDKQDVITNVKRRVTDAGFAINNKRIITARKLLMKEAVEGSTCMECNNIIANNTESLTAPCGHKFHYKCMEDKKKCSVCGEIIEKGFTIY